MFPVEREEYDQKTGHRPEYAPRYVSDIGVANRFFRDQKAESGLEPEPSHQLSAKGLREIAKPLLTVRYPPCGVPEHLADRGLRCVNRREKSERVTWLISHFDLSSDTIVDH